MPHNIFSKIVQGKRNLTADELFKICDVLEMADFNDLARIDYVISNYDSMELGNKKSSEFLNSDGSPADTIEISKQVDNRYFIIEAVPDNKAKSLQVVTAYMQTNKNSSKNKNQQSRGRVPHGIEHRAYVPPADVQNASANADFHTNGMDNNQLHEHQMQSDENSHFPSINAQNAPANVSQLNQPSRNQMPYDTTYRIDTEYRMPPQNVQNATATNVDNNIIPQDTEKVNDEIVPKRYNLTLKKFTNTKTKESQLLAKLDDKLPTEDFNKLRDLVKEVGGYYSNFAKGFLFKNDFDTKI